MHLVSIGLEIHVALTLDKKAFAPEDVQELSWISLGFPGTLPTLNIDAVHGAIQTAHILNCRVSWNHICFDRKNYFYHDLPRGYQITQYFHPIGKGGHLLLSNGKRIGIRQAHLEEDTAQQFIQGDRIALNFSRLGRALVEIVTEPDFEGHEEVEEFLGRLRSLLTFNNLSEAAYEKGDMRVDLNISVRKNPQDPLNVKSEVKNLNSLKAIKGSIQYLVNLKKNETGPTESLTYTWSEESQSCLPMRKKGDSPEYFYVPEANIPPFAISEEKYKSLTSNLVTDLEALSEDWRTRGLREPEINFLMNNHRAYTWVERIDKQINNLSSSYNWMVNIVSGITESFDWPDALYPEIERTILETEQTKKINLKIAKLILKEILENGLDFKAAHKKLDVKIITDEKQIKELINGALEQYRDQLPKLKTNPPKLEKLIIGECMKQSRGRADPATVKRIYDQLIVHHL